jgi:multisubunit Na+/H+ antiporter MnhF subunit
MRWVCFLFFTAALLVVMVTPVAASTVISISAFPQQAHIGEVVTLNGSISGITTIAVYLFVTGPELDVRGVTLDNLNIPAGRGLFTTAPVNMRDGSWTYTWDTSVILGTLEPGKYTIYVESSPLDRLRYMSGEYATVDVEFLPSDKPVAQTPLEPAIPLIAVGFVTTLGLWRYRTGKET